jgi:predicted nucleotidyltransferase component of viral defense system
LTGYELEELLGTKMRALYQRRKGRDLFDLYWALKNHSVDVDKLIQCYKTYIEFSVDKPPTQKQFLSIIEGKMTDKEFLDDFFIILKQSVDYDNKRAWNMNKSEFN